ncbi:MAG TPA: DUF2252 family protein [Pirellulales bacterium]|jgi:uncharacterized protein (DUF2252 family)|nr:DUF2252 family protein [Pirellulales bacterium]
MSRDPVQEVIGFNQRFVGRYPALLRQKIDRMSESPFGFFRGSFHLFAKDMLDGVLDPWQNSNPFTQVELALIGDIHSENFGTFKADDGAVHFDVNDFDETTHGSFDFDCKRAAASLFLAAAQHRLDWLDATGAVAEFSRSYCKQVAAFAKSGGQDRFGFSDKQLPDVPLVKRLICEANESSRSEFIEKLTVADGHHRKINRSSKFFDLTAADREQCERLMADYLKRVGAKKRDRQFYDVEDTCGRVAGNGSLGRLRYAALLQGDGSEGAKNVMLEIKESLLSAYDEARGREKGCEAAMHRAQHVVDVERRMQTASNRHLGYAVDGTTSFQVREIGPRDRRLEWQEPPGTAEYRDVARLYARLLAKCHAKAAESTGKNESAAAVIAEALHDRLEVFVKRLTAFALAYSELVEDDHRRFVARKDDVLKALHVPPEVP